MSSRIALGVLVVASVGSVVGLGFSLQKGADIAESLQTGETHSAPNMERAPSRLPTSPRALYVYPTQPVPPPPSARGSLAISAEQADADIVGGTEKHANTRANKPHGVGSVLLGDDFEGRRISARWKRTSGERVRCGLLTDHKSGNRVLRLRSSDDPEGWFVKASTGDASWADYEVRFRFYIVRGMNAYFEFRSNRVTGKGRGSAFIRDGIQVQTDKTHLTAASQTDGLLGAIVFDAPGDDPTLRGDRAAPAEVALHLSSGVWYRVVARMKDDRFNLFVQEQRDSQEETSSSIPRIASPVISARTRLRSGGIVMGVYRGEMWVDDLKVCRL